MKKGIVLLLSLFFISLLSVLVLKNLNDTDSFLKKQNFVQENTKLLIATKNTQEQLSSLLEKNKDKLEQVFSNGSIQSLKPISLNEIDLSFSINKYERLNINKIPNSQIEKSFYDDGVYDYDSFIDIYKQKLGIRDFNNKHNDKIVSYEQINDIIDDFMLQTQADKIVKSKLKNKLGFKDKGNLYELRVFANNENLKTNSYYILNNNGGVEYFEVSFK